MSEKIMPGSDDGLHGEHSHELLFRTAVTHDVVGRNVTVKYLRNEAAARRLAKQVMSHQEVKVNVRDTAIELAPADFPGSGYLLRFYLNSRNRDVVEQIMHLARDYLRFDDIIPGYREPRRS